MNNSLKAYNLINKSSILKLDGYNLNSFEFELDYNEWIDILKDDIEDLVP